MDLRDRVPDEQPTDDDELNAIAARIRPLPAHILPSRRFMEQMRLRLLNLTSERASKAA